MSQDCKTSPLRTRDCLVYVLLCLLTLGFVGWQYWEHERFQQNARMRLQAILRNISRSLEIIVGAQRRRGGIVPREPLEGALDAIVENGPMTSVAVYNSEGRIIAGAGEPPVLPELGLEPGASYWTATSLTAVQLVQLGRFESSRSRRRDGPDSDEPNEDRRDDLVILDRDTAHRLMQEFFAKQRSEAATGPETAGEFDKSLHAFMRRRGKWSRSMDPEVLRQYGLSRLVVTISTRPIDRHIQRDFWMRVLLSGIFMLAQGALAWGWYTSRRSARLNLELVRTQEQNRHLREMNLAAAGLAHETKNPLNVIRGLAQTVRASADLPTPAYADADLLISEVDAVTSRLNEFIEYSRPATPQPETVDLQAVIQDTARVLKADLDEKHAEFALDGESIKIQADPKLLRQVLFNLMLNACQMIPENGHVRCQIVDATGEVIIEDDGPGVPETERTEIFRPYYSLRPEGTGLGLAVVQQICDAHGWQMHCEDSDLGGARFRLSGLFTDSGQESS